MRLGFNHNIRYRGDIFHVQTEDSGVANSTITTLVYRDGTIIASRKTSYADIIKFEGLEEIVDDLMKEQHKGMLRSLKNGDFDERAFPETVREDPGPAPFASSVPESPPARSGHPKSLDDILLDYLASEGKGSRG